MKKQQERRRSLGRHLATAEQPWVSTIDSSLKKFVIVISMKLNISLCYFVYIVRYKTYFISRNLYIYNKHFENFFVIREY